MAKNYRYQAKYDESLVFFNRSIEIYTQINDKQGIVNVTADIGVLFGNLSEYSRALEFMNIAFEKAVELNDSALLSKIYNNEGLVYLSLGDYERALDYFYKSLKIHELSNNLRWKSYAYNNIGIVHEKMKEYDKALDYNFKSLEIKLELKRESDIVFSYSNISELYTLKGDFEDALKYEMKSLEINKKLKYKLGTAFSLYNISNIYIGKEDYKNAIQYIDKSYALMQELNNKEYIFNCHINYGKTFLKLGELEKAEYHLLTALKISNDINSKEAKLISNEILSTTYFILRDYKKAYAFQNNYIELNSELFAEEKIKNINELQTRFSVENKETEIAILKKDQEVQKLALEKSKVETRNQKTIRNFSITVLITLIIISFLLFNRYRVGQKRAKLEFEKHHAETENRLLRSQMNPHFIFNSLYSIQGFIGRKDAKAAQAYLVDFASLMRAILNNSSQSFISLEEELESLRLYLKLEQLRFDGNFNFDFVIDENVDQEFTLVPPMLIQPFVENSIVHGLFPKQGNGNITILIKEQDKSVLCSIIDDGIGRVESMKKKEKEVIAHKSVGIEVTKNRIILLGQEMKVPTYLKIIDLKDENDKPLGTRVDVVIPIKEA